MIAGRSIGWGLHSAPIFGDAHNISFFIVCWDCSFFQRSVGDSTKMWRYLFSSPSKLWVKSHSNLGICIDSVCKSSIGPRWKWTLKFRTYIVLPPSTGWERFYSILKLRTNNKWLFNRNALYSTKTPFPADNLLRTDCPRNWLPTVSLTEERFKIFPTKKVSPLYSHLILQFTQEFYFFF